MILMKKTLCQKNKTGHYDLTGFTYVALINENRIAKAGGFIFIDILLLHLFSTIPFLI